MPSTPYGNPFSNAAIPLIVRGQQLWYPRNVNQRLVPPNRYNYMLECEDHVWNSIIQAGGISVLCPGMGTIYVDPPWVKMPAQGRRFSKINSIALPAPAQFNTDLLVTSMLVPLGWDGAIILTTNQFSGTNFTEGSGDITWRLKINQRYVKDMGQLTTTLGTLTQPWPVNNGSIRIVSRQLVQFFANVANANPVNGRIICGMFGWFYPR